MKEIQTSNISKINELHSRVSSGVGAALEQISEATIAGWECGKLLTLEKAKCKPGDWLLWLSSNCPEITERTAQRYMERAGKYDTLSDMQLDLQRIASLKSIGLIDEPESQPSVTMAKPDAGLLHIQRACQYFNQHDLLKMNELGRRVWKERLKPLVELYEKL